MRPKAQVVRRVQGHLRAVPRVTLVMRSISAAPDLVAGLKAARVRVVPLLSCSKYRLVSSCNSSTLLGGGERECMGVGCGGRATAAA